MVKEEPEKGYITTIPSLVKLAVPYYRRKSVCEGKRQYHTGRSTRERGRMQTRRLRNIEVSGVFTLHDEL